MPREKQGKKIMEKLDRATKYSIWGLQNLESRWSLGPRDLLDPLVLISVAFPVLEFYRVPELMMVLFAGFVSFLNGIGTFFGGLLALLHG